MTYSVDLLTTAAECDALLALLAKDRALLEQRQSLMQFQLTQFDSTSPEVARAHCRHRPAGRY